MIQKFIKYVYLIFLHLNVSLPLPLPSWPSSPSQSDLIGTSTRVGGPNNLDPKVAEVIDIARRTVGLHKIVKDDLARMRLEHHGGATTEKEEKVLGSSQRVS